MHIREQDCKADDPDGDERMRTPGTKSPDSRHAVLLEILADEEALRIIAPG